MSNPTTPTGQGDITDPYAWIDTSGNVPPLVYQNVPQDTSYPLNGDGRYWWSVNAETPLYTSGSPSSPIYFIGNDSFVVDTASLQWTISSVANDGSALYLAYRTSGSGAYTTTLIGPAGGATQTSGLQSGQILATLTSGSAFDVAVYASGGSALTTATSWEVAVAITRNVNEALQFDYPNPFNPMSYNGACMDEVVPTDTLADLRYRLLVRLGFAVQASNPPPGMAALCNDFLQSAQTYLYRRYMQLHTRRLFRWKINPGQRFYSLQDNDEDVLCDFTMDPMKKIEWAGIQDTRNVWYPLIQGIPPQLYTMIDKPWRPARYDIKQSIEVYPAPDQTYWMWMRGHFGLRSFTADTDLTTLDSELVFLWALANAKSHYGQPDANNIAQQANMYRAELIAGTHQTAHYIPGTIAVPPAVRPTLIQYQDNQSG